jgi:hypothetical protein
MIVADCIRILNVLERDLSMTTEMKSRRIEKFCESRFRSDLNVLGSDLSRVIVADCIRTLNGLGWDRSRMIEVRRSLILKRKNRIENDKKLEILQIEKICRDLRFHCDLNGLR